MKDYNSLLYTYLKTIHSTILEQFFALYKRLQFTALNKITVHSTLFWSKLDVEKYHLFTQAGFESKLFYPKKCVNCNLSEFATKQRKVYFTKSMSKIRLPHTSRGNNYVIINKISSF